MPLDTRDLEQKVKSLPTGDDSMLAREPEDVTRALARIQQCIDKAEEQRQKVVATGALSSDQEATMINGLNIHARAEIAQILAPLHPADVAYILEALPQDDRMLVWDLVSDNKDGDVLVEVNDGVRETLIEAMDREELVDAMETLDTDEIADLVDPIKNFPNP